MAQTATTYEHVALNDTGVAVIRGTGMKILQLVLEYRAYGWSPEELHFQHPELSLGQVHSALAYYWDHQSEFGEAIQKQLRRIRDIEEATPTTPFVTSLAKANQ